MSLSLLRYDPKDYYIGTAVYPSDNAGVPLVDDLGSPSIPPTPPPSDSEDTAPHVYSPPADYFTPLPSSTLSPLSSMFPHPVLPDPVVLISYGKNTLPKLQVMFPAIPTSMPYSDVTQDYDLPESHATESIVQTTAQSDKEEPDFRDDDHATQYDDLVHISRTSNHVDEPTPPRCPVSLPHATVTPPQCRITCLSC